MLKNTLTFKVNFFFYFQALILGFAFIYLGTSDLIQTELSLDTYVV